MGAVQTHVGEQDILFRPVQNIYGHAGILQEGETDRKYCRAPYINLYSCGPMVCVYQPENGNDQLINGFPAASVLFKI